MGGEVAEELPCVMMNAGDAFGNAADSPMTQWVTFKSSAIYKKPIILQVIPTFIYYQEYHTSSI